ncbi:hypothetical protein TNCV_4624151 [Trichonephila clavipes]|nr:hypothetical protein TNCV_4624151 [Trichonephila clavipes]
MGASAAVRLKHKKLETKGKTKYLLKVSLTREMLTITVQHISYEVQLQLTLLHHPLAVGEDSLPDSKLALAGNGRSVRNFRLTFYKRSDDSHLRDEQQRLYWTLVYQPQHSRCFIPGLNCIQLFVD